MWCDANFPRELVDPNHPGQALGLLGERQRDGISSGERAPLLIGGVERAVAEFVAQAPLVVSAEFRFGMLKLQTEALHELVSRAVEHRGSMELVT